MSSPAKPKPATAPMVFTANRLRDGRVVWLAEAGTWVEPCHRCPGLPARRGRRRPGPRPAGGARPAGRRRLRHRGRAAGGPAGAAEIPRAAARSRAPRSMPSRPPTASPPDTPGPRPMNAHVDVTAPAYPPHARTYRYDEVDREFLADRTAEFRGQVDRRLAGELTEDQFKPLRLMNGLYLQLHAYMLRIAIPYGSLNADAAAQAGLDRAHLRQGLRPLHHAHQHAVPLDQAEGRAGHPGAPGRGRHARHPDLRQLHPQRHRRPLRRRHRRRGRRPARLGRGDPPVVDPAPGIQLPAAQVQDRRHRGAARTARRPSSTTSACS